MCSGVLAAQQQQPPEPSPASSALSVHLPRPLSSNPAFIGSPSLTFRTLQPLWLALSSAETRDARGQGADFSSGQSHHQQRHHQALSSPAAPTIFSPQHFVAFPRAFFCVDIPRSPSVPHCSHATAQRQPTSPVHLQPNSNSSLDPPVPRPFSPSSHFSLGGFSAALTSPPPPDEAAPSSNRAWAQGPTARPQLGFSSELFSLPALRRRAMDFL
jgi:hypothetical protein